MPMNLTHLICISLYPKHKNTLSISMKTNTTSCLLMIFGSCIHHLSVSHPS